MTAANEWPPSGLGIGTAVGIEVLFRRAIEVGALTDFDVFEPTKSIEVPKGGWPHSPVFIPNLGAGCHHSDAVRSGRVVRWTSYAARTKDCR